MRVVHVVVALRYCCIYAQICGFALCSVHFGCCVAFPFLKEKENGMSVIASEENDTFQDLMAMTSVLILFIVHCSRLSAWVQTPQLMDSSKSAPRQGQSLRLLVLGDRLFGISSRQEVCI